MNGAEKAMTQDRTPSSGPASRAEACAVLAPMGDSIVIPGNGHAANIEQPKAFNEALRGG